MPKTPGRPQEDIPFPYAPKAGINNPHLVAAQAEPLDVLYNNLIPEQLKNSRSKWSSPVLRCGWRLDEAQLMSWCKANSCLKVTPSDDGDLNPDITRSFGAGAAIILQQAGLSGIKHLSLRLRVPHTTPSKHCYIVSFMTNYEFKRFVNSREKAESVEIVERLEAKLVEAGWVKPENRKRKWYLDNEEWEWKGDGAIRFYY